jgi:hypothetical protein
MALMRRLKFAFPMFGAIAVAQPASNPLPEIPRHEFPLPPLKPPAPRSFDANRPDQPESAKAQHNTDNEKSGTDRNPFVIKMVPSDADGQKRAEETKQGLEKSPADWWTVWLTSALVFVGVLQFFALVGQGVVFWIQARRLRETINLTRDIADRQERDTRTLIAATQSNANAAMAQVEAMRQLHEAARAQERTLRDQSAAAIAVQRAFVFVRGLQTVGMPTAIQITATWENGGLTPTQHASMWMNWKTFPGGIPDDFDFPDLDVQGNPVASVEAIIFSLGPKASWESWSAQVPFSIIEAVVNGHVRLFLWGWVDYNDIFPDTPRHRTEMCAEFIVDSFERRPIEGGAEIKITSSRFVNHRRFNGADDDCYRQPVPRNK